MHRFPSSPVRVTAVSLVCHMRDVAMRRRPPRLRVVSLFTTSGARVSSFLNPGPHDRATALTLGMANHIVCSVIMLPG